MNLLEYVRRRLPDADALLAALDVAPYRGLDASQLDARFPAFRRDLARRANELARLDDRLELYREAHDLMERLRADGLATHRYELRNSFLSSDEVNLAILRALQTPMSQEELASSVLRCSTQAVSERASALQDGWRLGDMLVRIAPRYGGRLESTVHPVLLPLNLTEVYVLLGILGRAAQGGEQRDPHSVIARDLAQKVYFQLSDYARGRIDQRLEEQGALPGGGKPPANCVEVDRSAGGGPLESLLRSREWAFLEKTGELVEVTVGEKNGEPTTYRGTLCPWERPEPHIPAGDVRNPANFFTLRREDGSFVALHWGDVADVRRASGEQP